MKLFRVKGMPLFIVTWADDKKMVAFGFDTLAKRFVHCYGKIIYDVTFPSAIKVSQ